MSDSAGETTGMRVVFWTWTTIIAIGLADVIVTALSGR
jgi:hypothetical protein